MDTLVTIFLSTAIVYMIWSIIRTAIYFGQEQHKYHVWKDFALSSIKDVVPMIQDLVNINDKKLEKKEESTILDFNQND